MDVTTLLGFFSALLIGLSLGLIGGGGSILTVPVLVYMMGIEPVLATAYSLFVVGATSFVGALQYMRKGLLSYKTAVVFAVPSFVAVFATRKYLLPALPNSIQAQVAEESITAFFFGLTLLVGVSIAALMLLKVDLSKAGKSFWKVVGLMAPAALMVFVMRQWVIPMVPDLLWKSGEFELTKGAAIMILFAIIMLVASYSMIKGRSEKDCKPKRLNGKGMALVVLEGAGVGTLTGIVGAGGGFLIIPALVILAGLPMKQAVGTSLLIITVKSLIGFVGDLSHQTIDWGFLLLFTSLSIAGIFVGSALSSKIPGEKLKKGFGWFVLVMALFLLGKQIF